MRTTSRKAWLLRSAAALVVAGAGALALGSGAAVAARTTPARTTFPPATGAVLPGGAQEHVKVDGGAGEHTLAAPAEVTVAEDGAATVTTLSDASNVIVLACLGLLLAGAAAYALVAWNREEPRAG